MWKWDESTNYFGLTASYSDYKTVGSRVSSRKAGIGDNRIISKLLQRRDKPTGLLWGYQRARIRFCAHVLCNIVRSPE